eukprot:m.22176 g.22176  ORF g.22176 m.22176 type:complete len:76 (-) comp12871_c0_seq1:142-369(-)
MLRLLSFRSLLLFVAVGCCLWCGCFVVVAVVICNLVVIALCYWLLPLQSSNYHYTTTIDANHYQAQPTTTEPTTT